MSLLLIIAGLVLLLAGSAWFTGATTVGAILAIAGGAWLLIQVVLFVIIALTGAKKVKNARHRGFDFDSRWP